MRRRKPERGLIILHRTFLHTCTYARAGRAVRLRPCARTHERLLLSLSTHGCDGGRGEGAGKTQASAGWGFRGQIRGWCHSSKTLELLATCVLNAGAKIKIL